MNAMRSLYRKAYRHGNKLQVSVSPAVSLGFAGLMLIVKQTGKALTAGRHRRIVFFRQLMILTAAEASEKTLLKKTCRNIADIKNLC
jgi:Tfp pilus assembly protein PilN